MISNQDLLALQSYVTAADSTAYSQLGATTLLLNLTHSNLKQKHIEIRFDKHTTVSTLRQRIHQKTGTPPCFQHLQILSNSNFSQIITEIPPDNGNNIQNNNVNYSQHKLGFFPLENGSTIHCIDLDPHSGSKNGQYEDTSLIQKYKMSDDDYNQRKGTLRHWSRLQKEKDSQFTLAKHAKEHREKMEVLRQYKLGLPLPDGWTIDSKTGSPIQIEEEEHENSIKNDTKSTSSSPSTGVDSVQHIHVNMRCQVQPGARRGEVRFVGEIEELGSGGYWVGIKFDEPVTNPKGNADGSVPGKGEGRGKQYFEVIKGYGGFCRGKNVEVGDFPEIDIFADSDSEDEI